MESSTSNSISSHSSSFQSVCDNFGNGLESAALTREYGRIRLAAKDKVLEDVMKSGMIFSSVEEKQAFLELPENKNKIREQMIHLATSQVELLRRVLSKLNGT